MDWARLLDGLRLQDPTYAERPNRPTYVQDSDRITFSAPFRRLANKTQVHPLYENDHIHHRLIHSLETSSVGRSLGMEVGDWLEQQQAVPAGERHKIAGIIGTACLAHDIGNPPFGHSGEEAIGQWFAEKFASGEPLFSELDQDLRLEFEKFEGNAQGFRILTRLEMYRNEGGMRLSRGVLGAFSKYPVTARVQDQVKSDYCGLKKFGVFESEFEQFCEVAKAVGLPSETHDSQTWWRRHPLVFLVEAADDICYNILDLEDAFTSGDLSAETVIGHLEPVTGKSNQDLSDMAAPDRIAYARARGIGIAISACVEAFKENYAPIMDGTFSGALIDKSAKAEEFNNIKNLAKERLFTSPRKTELEVQGRNSVHRVLDGISGIYVRLQEVGWDAEKLDSYHRQLIKAAGVDIRDVTTPYTALHSLADYVSGMTDRFAVKTARMLSGI
ncbi:dGTP triphosphohydrolase [uncultured Roseibium sp.]|uniref:dGTP triphosphohydrolase n=1 Tax=uncultured Roseibium sp. TaxID=1936171 RepID=UPI003217D3B7